VFKPLHGFAGRGLLDSAAVGRARLRRLVKRGDGYVAPKMGSETLHRRRGTALMDGPPSLGLSGADPSPFGARLPTAGSAGVNATGRVATYLCVSLTPR
jgi:hypothetical protein